MSTSYNLGTVSALSTKTPETQINEIVAKTQAALNELSTAVAGDNSNSALLRYQVPIDSGVQKGHLVYWEAGTSTGAAETDGRYSKALAELSGEGGWDGASVETERSHVEGIIIEANHDGNSHTGTLLVCGSWTDTAAMTTCLQSSTAVQGIYYLSPTTPGTAVQASATHGKLQQGLLAYHGAGSFTLNLFYQANDHHYHGSAWLASGNWKAADSTHVKPTLWQHGYWYDGASDGRFVTAGPLSTDSTSLFMSGALQRFGSAAADLFFIDADGVLWYNGNAAPTGACVMFNHFPFAYGSPVVRSIRTEGALLSAVNSNGIVTISQAEYSTGAPAYSASAVSALADGIAHMTPVISNLIAGPGISVSSDASGQATLSTSNLIGTPLDAYGMTHNGTVMTNSGLFQYLTFPKGRSASVVISMPVVGVGASTQLQALCWGELEGNPGATFNVVSNFIPLPYSGSGSYTPSATVTQTLTFSGGSGGSGTSYVEYAETSSGPTFTGNGMLVASITISNPSATYDIRLLRLGFRLNIASASSVAASETESLQYVLNKQTASTTNPPAVRKGVRMTSSGLQLCRADDSTAYNTCIGVAAYREGTLMAYITAGAMNDAAFSFGAASVGAAVYLGTDGSLTTTAPSTGYIQRVGTVLSNNTVLIGIQPALAISE